MAYLFGVNVGLISKNVGSPDQGSLPPSYILGHEPISNQIGATANTTCSLPKTLPVRARDVTTDEPGSNQTGANATCSLNGSENSSPLTSETTLQTQADSQVETPLALADPQGTQSTVPPLLPNGILNTLIPPPPCMQVYSQIAAAPARQIYINKPNAPVYHPRDTRWGPYGAGRQMQQQNGHHQRGYRRQPRNFTPPTHYNLTFNNEFQRDPYSWQTVGRKGRPSYHDHVNHNQHNINTAQISNPTPTSAHPNASSVLTSLTSPSPNPTSE